jgi:hypothetical protein
MIFLAQLGPTGEMEIQELNINATSGTITITIDNTGNTTLSMFTVLTDPPTAGVVYPYELNITCTPSDCTFQPGEEISVLVEDLEIDPDTEYRVIARASDGTQASATRTPIA